MEVRAKAKNVSVSPKKLRRMVGVVRGLPVNEALTVLRFLPSAAAADIAKVIRSAVANAENNYQMNPDALKIVGITADEGMKLRRFRASARGRAGSIHKRHSHITVVIDEKEQELGA